MTLKEISNLNFKYDTDTYINFIYGQQASNMTTEDQRELIISHALSTSEGRASLAQVMVAPITTSIMYLPNGKTLMVDEITPQMAENYDKQLQQSLENIAKKTKENNTTSEDIINEHVYKT